MTDLIEVTEVKNAPSLLELGPHAMVTRATEIADVLKDVISTQKLFVKLNGNDHVKAEGWSTLGTMLNILPKEEKVIEHADGSFEAYVSLINNRTGMVCGGGSGFVGMDEKNWASKPKYARRSMAITRATSKAYKTCFSWIVSLAGYNPTPAEEMEFLDANPKTDSAVYTGSPAQKNLLAKLFDKHQIVGEDRKRIHTALIENKIKYPDEMDAAVQELKVPIPF